MQTELTPSDLVQQRRQAHALLDVLTAEKLTAVRSLLEVMAEPLSRSLALAPVEEEELTDQTVAEIAAARASLRRGEGIPHDEILREFGLS
jgi:hypothetical protein